MADRTEADKAIEAARERLRTAKDGDRAFLLDQEIKRLQVARRTRVIEETEK